MGLDRARRGTYRLGRLLGDVNAAGRGPAAMGRRVTRRQAYRGVLGPLARWLRRLGV